MHLAKLVSAAAAVSVLALPVLAQGQDDHNSNSDNNNNSPTPSGVSAAETPSASTPADSASTPVSSPSPSPSPSPSRSSSSNDPPKQSSTTSSPSSSSSSKESKSTASPSPSSSSSSSPSSSPSSSTRGPTMTSSTTTSSRSAGSFSIPTGLPTLTGNRGIPTYPPASVPPTKNAPFMKQSAAPSGTVFIAVGSILGAFGIALLIWRAIVSFLLHRSVSRAALAQHADSSKPGGDFPAPPAPFYKDTDASSSPASGAAAAVSAAAARRAARRTSRAPGAPLAAQSQANLFFSPTAAGTANPGSGRGSVFLPSGFYNAGSSSPGGATGPSISMTNLRPESMAQTNASRITLDRTPPDSPHSPNFQARRDVSSTSLAPRLPGQRAPSAYLDDLLADETGSLPSSQMPSSHKPGTPRS